MEFLTCFSLVECFMSKYLIVDQLFFSYKITASIDFLFTFLKNLCVYSKIKKITTFEIQTFIYFFMRIGIKKIELEKQYAKIK